MPWSRVPPTVRTTNEKRPRHFIPFRLNAEILVPAKGAEKLSLFAEADRPYVSTGHLPAPDLVQKLVAEAYAKYKSNTEGENSQVYPALARVPATLFGICVVGTNGAVQAVGDTDHEFSIMSVSKPFLFALVCQLLGAEETRAKLSANATGFAFNSVAGI